MTLLSGVDAIADFTGAGVSDVMDWIRSYVDCPVRLNGATWEVSRRDLKKWLARVKPEISSRAWMDKPISKRVIKKQRRW